LADQLSEITKVAREPEGSAVKAVLPKTALRSIDEIEIILSQTPRIQVSRDIQYSNLKLKNPKNEDSARMRIFQQSKATLLVVDSPATGANDPGHANVILKTLGWQPIGSAGNSFFRWLSTGEQRRVAEQISLVTGALDLEP